MNRNDRRDLIIWLALLALVLAMILLTGCGPLLRITRTAPPATPARPVRTDRHDEHRRQAARYVADVLDVTPGPRAREAADVADVLSADVGAPARRVPVPDTDVASAEARVLARTYAADVDAAQEADLDYERRMETWRSTPRKEHKDIGSPAASRLFGGGLTLVIVLGVVVLIVGAPAVTVIAWLWRRARSTYRALREVVVGVEHAKPVAPERVQEQQKARLAAAQSPDTRRTVDAIRREL